MAVVHCNSQNMFSNLKSVVFFFKIKIIFPKPLYIVLDFFLTFNVVGKS